MKQWSTGWRLLLLAILFALPPVKDSACPSGSCNIATAALPPASLDLYRNTPTVNHTITTSSSSTFTLRTLQSTSCKDELEACNEGLKELQDGCSFSSANLWLAKDDQQEEEGGEETNEAGGNIFSFLFDVVFGIINFLLSLILGFFNFIAEQGCRNSLKECRDQTDSFVCPIATTQSPTVVPIVAPPTPPTNTLQPQPGEPAPTLQPVSLPTTSTQQPRPVPSRNPLPQSTQQPVQNLTPIPTQKPSPQPTRQPSRSPTQQPVRKPTPQPTSRPVEPKTTVTTFYALGDAPYDSAQEALLAEQMENLPNDDGASFVVHVGDLRKNNGQDCTVDEFRNVASILSLSPIPVFVFLGDNDWNDCKNPKNALEYWRAEFVGFEERFWEPTFAVVRLSDRPENLSFIHNEVLFIGLNIVGGSFESEWEVRLDEELQWSLDLVRSYVQGMAPRIGRIVLFGHANPNSDHRRLFFDPLADFIEQELGNETPFLYVNGDGHVWRYQTNYLNQESLVRIMVSAYAEEPPVRISVHANGQPDSTTNAFQFIR